MLCIFFFFYISVINKINVIWVYNFLFKKIRKNIQNNVDKIDLSNKVFRIGVSIKKIKTFLQSILQTEMIAF